MHVGLNMDNAKTELFVGRICRPRKARDVYVSDVASLDVVFLIIRFVFFCTVGLDIDYS